VFPAAAILLFDMAGWRGRVDFPTEDCEAFEVECEFMDMMDAVEALLAPSLRDFLVRLESGIVIADGVWKTRVVQTAEIM
jgi:hypothetical protein